jgi:MFS transporter, MHS family, proline/betaine transporter
MSKKLGGKGFAASLASLFAWSLDLFDLFIVIYVAPYVGRAFFASDSTMLSLAGAYLSFSITLLMRPFGSALFGHFADTYGRKGPMLVSVTGIGLTTALMGTIPTIEQIGVAAPIIFIILRIVQGIFAGGILASTHTIGTESIDPKWRGLASGVIGGGGAGLGALMASLAFFVTSSIFPGQQFADEGWRYMFFAGGITSLFSLFIAFAVHESPAFLAAKMKRELTKEKKHRNRIGLLFSEEYRKILLKNVIITMSSSGIYYISAGYLPSFLNLVNGLPNTSASVILAGASISAVAASILIGMLSDFIGRRRTFLVVGLFSAIALPFCFTRLGVTQDLTSIWAYALIISFIGNATYAPLLIFLNERFPTDIRATGTGLSWNIGSAFGGLMPVLVSLSTASIGNVALTLSAFAVVLCAAYLIGAFIAPETRSTDL